MFLFVPRRVPYRLFATTQQRNNVKLDFLRRLHHECLCRAHSRVVNFVKDAILVGKSRASG